MRFTVFVSAISAISSFPHYLYHRAAYCEKICEQYRALLLPRLRQPPRDLSPLSAEEKAFAFKDDFTSPLGLPLISVQRRVRESTTPFPRFGITFSLVRITNANVFDGCANEKMWPYTLAYRGRGQPCVLCFINTPNVATTNR